MIAIKPVFKMQFFDRSIVKTNWKKINESPLKRAGLIVRKIAIGSIRKQGKRKKHSGPNQPPKYNPTKKKGGTPAFHLIYSVPTTFDTSVTVGMVGFGGGNPVPGLHEHGGVAKRRVFIKAGQRRTKKGRFGKNFRKPVTKIVHYAKRPFMKPAEEKGRSKYPQLWEGSLTK